MNDPLRNVKDPLHKMGPEVEKELLRNLGQVASGFPKDVVVNAAMWLVINTLRQDAATWQRAEVLWNEYFGRHKENLRNHYDANGKRRNVFPFTQNVDMPLFQNKQSFKP